MRKIQKREKNLSAGSRIALIPAYEPAEILIEVVMSVRKYGFRVVVVDDGSGEKFQEIFNRIQADADDSVTVLHHEQNRGKGSALKTGLMFLKKRDTAHEPAVDGADALDRPRSDTGRGGSTPAAPAKAQDTVIVTMDADGQHSAEDALRVCEAAWERPGTLILGSREFDRDVPLRSRFGNTVTRGVFSCVTGLRVTDTQTGLRAFTSDLTDFLLDIPGERYEYEMQMLLQCRAHQVPVLEIPIETIYMNGNAGSHFQTVRDSFLIYREIVKFAGSSFLSFLLDYSCYSLFLLFLAGCPQTVRITAANILARLISACFNYQMNRRFVFQSTEKPARTAVQYAALAVGILLCNTLLLNLFTGVLGIQQNLAKLIVELLLFLVSFRVQRLYIFRNGRSEQK